MRETALDIEDTPLTKVLGTLGVDTRKLELYPVPKDEATDVVVKVVVVEVTVDRREEETPCWI